MGYIAADDNIFSVSADVFEVYFDCNAFVSPMEPYYNCPLLTTVEICRKDVRFDLEYIKKTLNAGWYIIVYVDRSKLNEFHRHSRRHQIMICSYDAACNRFQFCDNDITGKYNTNLSCSVDELLSSYDSVENDPIKTTEWEQVFYLIKPRKDSSYILNLDDVVASLKKYLFLPPYNLPEEDLLYDRFGGIRSYDGLIENLKLPYDQWNQ